MAFLSRKHLLIGNGLDLGVIFAQQDVNHSGFVPRNVFMRILRECFSIIPIGEIEAHFLLMYLLSSKGKGDLNLLSYTFFLDFLGWDGRQQQQQWNHPTTSRGGVSWVQQTDHSPFPRNINFVDVVSPIGNHHNNNNRRNSFTNFVDFAVATPDIMIPKNGWICRVCSHQQVEDWVINCEICETSKPKYGPSGTNSGFIKCSNCQFENNYDLDECEMCGRPLTTRRQSIRSSSKKSIARKPAYSRSDHSSGSSSDVSSDSSSHSRRSSSSSSSRRRRSNSFSGRRKEVKRARFQRGEEVQAIPLGQRDYQTGVIAKVRENDFYDIEFDDGRYEKYVEEKCLNEIIRRRPSSSKDKEEDRGHHRHSASSSSDDDDGGEKKKEEEVEYHVGDKIEARFQKKNRYFSGVIRKCRSDGSYDIDYDDSEIELHVKTKYIRPLSSSTSPKKKKSSNSSLNREDVTSTTTDTDSSAAVPEFIKGQKVEIKIKGGHYMKGIIFKAHSDGRCDVELESGELEQKILPHNIRLRKSSSPKKKTSSIRNQEEEEDDERMINKSGTKNIVVDTSTSEEVQHRNGRGKFKIGQKIEAQFKGKNKFYPGVIARARLNGTYDIDYHDGEKETGVHFDFIRERKEESPSKTKKKK
jgi:hypothetical protein